MHKITVLNAPINTAAVAALEYGIGATHTTPAAAAPQATKARLDIVNLFGSIISPLGV